jgi:hypothetical protein
MSLEVFDLLASWASLVIVDWRKQYSLVFYCDPSWVGLNRDETLQDLSRDSARSCEDFLPSTLLHIM